MSSLAFIDIETTGLDPNIHEIWEVAAIVRQEDGCEVSCTWQLPVQDLDRADPIALDMTGFYNRRNIADEQIPLDIFCKQFAQITDGTHLIGAVVSFDEERLRRLFYQQSVRHKWHYHIIDVEALLAGHIMGMTESRDDFRGSNETRLEMREVAKPPWKSDKLSSIVGIDPKQFERHTAMGDALWAKAIYDSVMNPKYGD